MNDLEQQARNLKLHGLLAHWQEIQNQPWLAQMLAWEEQERTRRGLERRLRRARLGAFKPIADFDWAWPTQVDREQVEDLFRFDFLAERLKQFNSPAAFAFMREQIPARLTRMQAVADSVRGDAPLLVMDTAPAAILGAL